jgi:hypothetical protein
MTKLKQKQQRITTPPESPNRRDKKKQKPIDDDEKMEEIEEEMLTTDPKTTFPGIGAAAILLYKNPDADRWKKLNPQTKRDAKAYPLTSRFVPASESSDGISCHDDFAGAAKLYMVCNQIETTIPTQTANAITVDQWAIFLDELTSGPTTPVGKTKIAKHDNRRKAVVQFFTNLSLSDPTKLFSDSINNKTIILPDTNIGKTWLAANKLLGSHYPKPPTKKPQQEATKKTISFDLPDA